MSSRMLVAAALLLFFSTVAAQVAQVSPVQLGSDTPKEWHEPGADQDFIRREVMIPMRDGVKLHTVIVLPRGATAAPMVIERTPYDANSSLSGHGMTLRDNICRSQPGLKRLGGAIENGFVGGRCRVDTRLLSLAVLQPVNIALRANPAQVTQICRRQFAVPATTAGEAKAE